MRGRPTNAATAQHQALRDPQQTRINFGTARTQSTSAATLGPTAALDTTTAPTLDKDDIVIEIIVVGDNNES